MTERPIYEKYSFEAPYDISPATTYYPRSSAETYSSEASEDDLFDEPEEHDTLYDVPEYKEITESNPKPSTPQNFASFFPSLKRFYIRHDNSSYDGNMNLRVDTETVIESKKTTIQLFHLRMHDLKKREFSLRRYERSSGREVCHSSRKFAKSAAEKRPALARSMSSAFASIRKPEFKRASSGLSSHSEKSPGIQRQDSGYGSSDEIEDMESEKKVETSPVPTNATKLEFSNYAQVDVKRRGGKSSKRYDFEYWGSSYTWKRVTEKDGDGKAVSYHLFRDNGGPAVAHIVPELRSPSQVQAENEAGSWVPPCSMWISDKSVLEALTDVADVIISTGLITLVDDCIKRHFHSKKPTQTRQMTVPLTPLKLDMEFFGPKAMVSHMFKRRNSGGSTKERDSQKKSPLRFANPIEAF
jgi:hypothetical protein